MTRQPFTRKLSVFTGRGREEKDDIERFLIRGQQEIRSLITNVTVDHPVNWKLVMERARALEEEERMILADIERRGELRRQRQYGNGTCLDRIIHRCLSASKHQKNYRKGEKDEMNIGLLANKFQKESYETRSDHSSESLTAVSSQANYTVVEEDGSTGRRDWARFPDPIVEDSLQFDPSTQAEI